MHAGLTRSATLLVLLVTSGITARAQGTGASWLDASTITSWNAAGQDIPEVPAFEDPVNPRCRELARPPQTDEDRQLRDRGWDLVGTFQGGWNVIVVRGTASYDGMCRPLQFQDFVFVGGRFAGTLAPAPMDSRTDGALSQVALLDSSRLNVEYVRYEPSDSLCCPSRITHVEFDIAADPPVVHPRSASTSSTDAAPGGNHASAASAQSGLAGTSWQIVKFEGGDGTIVEPEARANYTIDFQSDGQLAARVACNRGRGTWASDGSNLELGPLALTRAWCPSASLHDHLVKHWDAITSYVIRDGHLFLSLRADGGIYEFEPVTGAR